MKEKTLAKMSLASKPFLEEGEQVRAAAPCFQGPRTALFFGLIGAMFIKQRVVLVTDRNVYVMRAGFISVKTPKGVEQKHPLGSVKVEAKSGLPLGTLMVGDLRLSVGKLYQKDAAGVAAAASGQG